MKVADEDYIAGRCCDAKTTNGIILISDVIKIVEHFTTPLEKEIERLKEFEWMYNDLCK